MKRSDPLGKRALFSVADEEPRETRTAGPLDVAVQCSSCDNRATTSIPDLVLRHFPLWFWMPGRKPGHLMRCSSCHDVAWHDITRAN
jgi:hypothetical protein